MANLLPFPIHVVPLVLISVLTIALSIITGVIGHFLYWLIFDSFGREKQRNQRKLQWINNQPADEYYTIIIGTGFSGLGMAIKLRQMGMNKFVLLERHGHVGGTWYANTYPGCACDVPSNLYSFSFEPNPKWSHYFSRQPEIQAYMEHCTDKYDIRRHIQFNTTVTELRWIQEKTIWKVITESNGVKKEFYGRFLVLGTGPLSNASYPSDIKGIEQFQGQMCHTATWDNNIDFHNKRVAVIGTGASAIQAVPEIQKMGVTRLFVFQRTPPWVIPRVDRHLNQWEKNLYRRFPFFQKLIRLLLYWGTESFALAFVYRWPLRVVNQFLVRFNLERQIKDESLRRKLTPNWEFGCKRMLITNDWYSTLQKPNVKLVTNRIRQLKENSIVTHDGDEYPVDIIIWSTGFQTQQFSLPVYGVEGESLVDKWSRTIQAYRGVTVPNFPNFFVLLGPNTGLGHNSVVIMIESQINYVAEAMLYMDKQKQRCLDVKNKAFRDYNNDLQRRLQKTVWQKGGCHSWYQDAEGNNTAIWPDFTWVYILMMKHFDHENYNLRN